MVEDRLRALGADEGFYAMTLKLGAVQVDPDEAIEDIEQGLVYLARYGRQSDVEYWEQQPMSRVNLWLRLISELIKRENTAAGAETDTR